jgi:hypothetical protein
MIILCRLVSVVCVVVIKSVVNLNHKVMTNVSRDGWVW